MWLITAIEITSIEMGKFHVLSVNPDDVFIDFTVGRMLAYTTFVLEMRKMRSRYAMTYLSQESMWMDRTNKISLHKRQSPNWSGFNKELFLFVSYFLVD